MGWICGITDLALAALFAVLALPLARRHVPMNLWYGVRIRQAYLSDDAWFDINEFGGRRLLWWALAPAIAGIWCLFFPFELGGQDVALAAPPFLSLAVLVCAALVPMLQVITYAAKRYPGPSSGAFRALFDMGYNPKADKQGLTKYSVLAIVLIVFAQVIVVAIVLGVVLFMARQT